MADIIFKRGLEENLPEEITDGQILVTTDSGNMYMDIGEERKQIGGHGAKIGAAGTGEHAEIFNDYVNSAAAGAYSSASGENNIAGQRYYEVKGITTGGVYIVVDNKYIEHENNYNMNPTSEDAAFLFLKDEWYLVKIFNQNKEKMLEIIIKSTDNTTDKTSWENGKTLHLSNLHEIIVNKIKSHSTQNDPYRILKNDDNTIECFNHNEQNGYLTPINDTVVAITNINKPYLGNLVVSDIANRAMSVMGNNNTAIGNQSFAMGLNNAAFGDRSMAIGKNTIAFGEGSFAGGENSQAYAKNSFAMGLNCRTAEAKSVSGLYVLAEGSMAIGQNNIVYNPASFAFGQGLTANGNCQFVIGKYNNANPNNIFEIGIGSDKNNKANALTVNKYTGLTTFHKGAETIMIDNGTNDNEIVNKLYVNNYTDSIITEINTLLIDLIKGN